MPYVALNNAFSTLAASLGNQESDVTITVATGHGARFAVGADYTYATLESAGGNMEIIRITAQSGDTLTVVRGQDGTTRLAWNIGDIIECRPCRAAMAAIKADAVTTANVALQVNAAVAKSIPVDADEFGIADSAASYALKKLSWANIKATLNTLYAKIGAITGSGLTMATAKLLGRSTASTGAVEEISIGTGLSLSGGTLTCTVTNDVTSVGGYTGAVTAANLLAAVATVDGPGSGLDADTLDGQHGSHYATASHTHSGYVSTDTGVLGVGSFALLTPTSIHAAPGGTLAGSNLRTIYFSSHAATHGSVASGTWRNHSGGTLIAGTNSDYGIFQRIS